MWTRRAAYACPLGLSIAILALLATGSGLTARPGDPLPGLGGGDLTRFQAGKVAFEDVEDAEDGLGPVFNNNSCVSCHFQAATGGGSDTLETRFGRRSGGVFDPLEELGGSLIQSQGIGKFGST